MVKLIISDPIVVSISKPGEKRWGVHQFPSFSRLPDNRILIAYSNGPDMYEYHGTPLPCYVSNDDGNSWEKLVRNPLNIVAPHPVIIELYNNEKLYVPVRHIKLAAKTRLPVPVAQKDVYGISYYYLAKDFSASVRKKCSEIPVFRWIPARKKWISSIMQYDISKLICTRKQKNMILPRTAPEHGFVKLNNELLWAEYRATHMPSNRIMPSSHTVSCIVSKDNGRSFKWRSCIAYDPEGKDGMYEPCMCQNKKKELVCVIRRTDHEQKPMLITFSKDRGITWSKPASIFKFGVFPNLLFLKNGVLVLSFGRPGVQISISKDGTGRVWSKPVALIKGSNRNVGEHTCGYTSLIELDRNSFLIAYTDFKYKNKKKKICKAILTRKITILSR